MKRKIVQITANNYHVFGLCDDGSVIKISYEREEDSKWVEVTPIPEKENDE